MLDQVFTSH
jgi:hypothetical protein